MRNVGILLILTVVVSSMQTLPASAIDMKASRIGNQFAGRSILELSFAHGLSRARATRTQNSRIRYQRSGLGL